MADQHRLQQAAKEADAIVERLALTAPVDPLAIVQSEKPLVRAGGRNLGTRYDGKLEYDRNKNRFLLFFNTKYDVDMPPGEHHPRTRFSIGHELGHYFLERHRAYLMSRRTAHPSKGEFRSDLMVEREADSFAASILLPTRLVRPMANARELSVNRLQEIANHFKASLVSTTFRCVRLSDFPCAVAGIRNGTVAWMFASEWLIEAGIYPRKAMLPNNAVQPWAEFQVGIATVTQDESNVGEWFRTYDRDDLMDVYVTEEFIPVSTMGTLLVLLTMDENDFYSADDEADMNDDE